MTNISKLEELVAVLSLAAFGVGCIATAHRSPRAIPAGSGSLGVGYTIVQNSQDSDADDIKLFSTDARFGLGRGIDWGILHTLDVTPENEKLYSTIWSDFRFQLTNRSNTPGKPIIGIGYGAGYVYDEDAELWITSFPLSIGFPMKRITPYLGLRVDYHWDEFRLLPKTGQEPRTTWTIGWDIPLGDKELSITPRLVPEIGIGNSLIGGEGDDIMVFNLNLNFDLRFGGK